MRRVLVREELCIGCGLCRVFCQSHHAGNDDPLKALGKRTTPAAGGIRLEQHGPECLSVRCRHCAEAACIDACITGAMHRDEETGFVLVEDTKCIGCGTCLMVCPYGAICRDPDTGRAVKCDGCNDRDVPRCVSVCPNGALVAVEEAPCATATAIRESGHRLVA